MISRSMLGKSILSSHSAASYTRIAKLNNPWALYMLDEAIPGAGFFTIKDSSGNARDMNATAIADFQNDTPLVAGAARSIKRFQLTQAAPVGANGPVAGNAAWAIDGWLRATSFAAGEKMIAGFGTSVAHQTAMAVSFSGAFAGDTNGCLFGEASPSSINTIYYFCVQWDGATLFTYKNAKLVGSGACAAMAIPAGGGSHELWLAPSGVAGTDLNNASLQAVGFYDHLLSQGAMLANYSAGIGATKGGIVL